MNDTIDAKNVGNNILHYRQNKEMSQSELAGLLCVSRTVVSRWETGDRLPETQMLPRICKVFGISLDELLYENNENAASVKEPKDEIENSKILFGFTKWPGTSQEKLDEVLNNALSGNRIENEIYVAFYFFTFPIKTISAMFNKKANEIYSYISIVNKRIFEALRENANTNRNVTKTEFITAISNIKNIDFGKIILKKTEADMEANHKKTILVPTIISVIAFTLTGLSLSYFITRQNISVGTYGWGQKKPNNAIIIKSTPRGEKDEPTKNGGTNKSKESYDFKEETSMGLNLDLKDYNLRFIDGKQYIQLKTEPLSPEEIQQCITVPYIRCDSLETLFEKIKNNDFSEKELKELARFQRSENGIEIFNLNKPFKLVFPADCSTEEIVWRDSGISCNVKNAAGETFKIDVFAIENFDDCYSNNIEYYIKDGAETVSHEKTENADKTIYITSSQPSKTWVKTIFEKAAILERHNTSTLEENNESVPSMLVCIKDCGDFGILLYANRLKKFHPAEYYLAFSIEN